MGIAEQKINIAEDGEEIMVGQGIKFERIRRITGYLVGTMNRWNNAKKAEEKDRIKHVSFRVGIE